MKLREFMEIPEDELMSYETKYHQDEDILNDSRGYHQIKSRYNAILELKLPSRITNFKASHYKTIVEISFCKIHIGDFISCVNDIQEYPEERFILYDEDHVYSKLLDLMFDNYFTLDTAKDMVAKLADSLIIIDREKNPELYKLLSSVDQEFYSYLGRTILKLSKPCDALSSIVKKYESDDMSEEDISVDKLLKEIDSWDCSYTSY